MSCRAASPPRSAVPSSPARGEETPFYPMLGRSHYRHFSGILTCAGSAKRRRTFQLSLAIALSNPS